MSHLRAPFARHFGHLIVFLLLLIQKSHLWIQNTHLNCMCVHSQYRHPHAYRCSSGMCAHKCSHRLYWTRRAWSTGRWRRLRLAEPQQQSPAQRSCRTSGWTAVAEVKGRVCESTPHGAWQSSTTGDRRRPQPLSKWRSNIEESVSLLTRSKDSGSIQLRFSSEMTNYKGK